MNQPKGRVVILNNPEDGHLPFVLRHLAEQPLIIDTSSVIDGQHLTYRIGAPHEDFEFLYDGEVVRDARSVWFRRMLTEMVLDVPDITRRIQGKIAHAEGFVTLPELTHHLLGNPEEPFFAEGMPVEMLMKKYAASSLNQLAGAIAHMFPTARWISSRDAIAAAMHKPAQLRVAHHFGLSVPATTITSDAEEAMNFLRYHGECVVKPLAVWAPWAHNQYTTVISSTNPPNFAGLEVNPHIFQARIKPLYEVRVTIVEDDEFSAEVGDTNPEATGFSNKRDWRTAFESGTFYAKKISLPEHVRNACFQIIRYYKLRAGMFDFVVDEEDGIWWYLEVNPNGAWGFIEEATGQPIGKAYANALQAA